MSYQPEVGDRVTDTNHEDEGTVLFVYNGQAAVLFDGELDFDTHGTDELVKVKPRPKVREQQLHFSNVGWLLGYDDGSEPNVRIRGFSRHDLDQIKFAAVAVVCDLSGEPLEVQA